MDDRLTEKQALEILHALDEAIEDGPWEQSNFLRVMGKNLRDIRDKYAKLLGDLHEVNESGKEQIQQANLLPGQCEIFISLYSLDGNNINSWERIIANLPKHVTSRPIYGNEQDVQHMIKSKDNKINEAYITFIIDQADILVLPADKVPRDKFGKSLITLKDRILRLENIKQFVHYSGVYQYTRGRLLKSP